MQMEHDTTPSTPPEISYSVLKEVLITFILHLQEHVIPQSRNQKKSWAMLIV